MHQFGRQHGRREGSDCLFQAFDRVPDRFVEFFVPGAPKLCESVGESGDADYIRYVGVVEGSVGRYVVGRNWDGWNVWSIGYGYKGGIL
jgi:hypothetical protein